MNAEPPPPEDASKAGGAIENIIAAAAGQEDGGASDDAPSIVALAERVDLLVADFGRWTDYKAASVEYIKEFTAEARWHRRTRAAVVVACGVLILCLALLLVVVLCHAQDIFGADPGHPLTALIVGTIGGAVIIAIAALRGAFATVKDRNEGLPMPEHVKELVEVGKNLFGKG